MDIFRDIATLSNIRTVNHFRVLQQDILFFTFTNFKISTTIHQPPYFNINVFISIKKNFYEKNVHFCTGISFPSANKFF